MYNNFKGGFKGVTVAAACVMASTRSMTVLLESAGTLIVIINSVTVEEVQKYSNQAKFSTAGGTILSTEATV